MRHGIAQGRFSGLPRLVTQQSLDAGFGVAALPAPDPRPTDPGLPGNGGDLEPLGREHDHPGLSDVLLRSVPIADDRRQTLAILSRDNGAERLGHDPVMAQTPHNMNLKNAS